MVSILKSFQLFLERKIELNAFRFEMKIFCPFFQNERKKFQSGVVLVLKTAVPTILLCVYPAIFLSGGRNPVLK